MGKQKRKEKSHPVIKDSESMIFSLGKGVGFLSLFCIFLLFIQTKNEGIEEISRSTSEAHLEANDGVEGECTIDPSSSESICHSKEDTGEEIEKEIEKEIKEDIKEESVHCKDTDERCEFWAEHGECDSNPHYMLYNCAVSCTSCDRLLESQKQASVLSNDEWMIATKEFGEQQKVDGAQIAETMEIIQKSVIYMRGLKNDGENGISNKVIESCLNRHDLCAFWAASGECDVNPSYMVTNCAPSCYSCDKIDFETRCPPRNLNPDKYVPGLVPGALNAMFDRIMEEGLSEKTNYTVSARSGPTAFTSKFTSAENNEIPDGPWVVTFDNFLSDEECDRLIQLGYTSEKGYERSLDVGKVKFDGSFDGTESKTRTSANAWCSDKCRRHPSANLIMERISNITGIPPANSEDFQLLRYDPGQFYRPHHDYIELQKNRQCGPRILTFFLYLSDVDAGGGTAFPNMNNLTVVPKKGRALLWPSVIDDDPSEVDQRTRHEALTVWAGRKYAANAWIHLFDYVTPQNTGCT